LALLMGRMSGQKGQQKLVALSDAAEYMAQPLHHGLTNEAGMLSGSLAEYSQYETASGWVAVAALEPHFRAKLKKELGLDKLSYQAVSEKLKQRTATEWVAWAKQRDIPLVKIKS